MRIMQHTTNRGTNTGTARITSQLTVPVTFFNGVTINFLDIIQSGTLYLNNTNVLSNFPGVPLLQLQTAS